MNIEQLAEEVRVQSRLARKRRHESARTRMLAGKSRDEQIRMVVCQLRARSDWSPRGWYK